MIVTIGLLVVAAVLVLGVLVWAGPTEPKGCSYVDSGAPVDRSSEHGAPELEDCPE